MVTVSNRTVLCLPPISKETEAKKRTISALQRTTLAQKTFRMEGSITNIALFLAGRWLYLNLCAEFPEVLLRWWTVQRAEGDGETRAVPRGGAQRAERALRTVGSQK